MGTCKYGALAALSRLIFAGRLNGATLQARILFELDGNAAAVIGTLVTGVLNNGMSLMGGGIDRQQAIKGLGLLSAPAIDILSKKKWIIGG